MANFFKKWFGGGNDKAKDEVLREPDLTIARANNEMQQRTQAATEMWGIDSAEWSVDVAIDGKYAGHIVINDTLKGGSAHAIRELTVHRHDGHGRCFGRQAGGSGGQAVRPASERHHSAAEPAPPDLPRELQLRSFRQGGHAVGAAGLCQCAAA